MIRLRRWLRRRWLRATGHVHKPAAPPTVLWEPDEIGERVVVRGTCSCGQPMAVVQPVSRRAFLEMRNVAALRSQAERAAIETLLRGVRP